MGFNPFSFFDRGGGGSGSPTTSGPSFGSNYGPSLIAGGADIISALIGSEGQSDANAGNIASAREQMAFQERMSSTAHQREVNDLRTAGLNPVLSANSGASTPVGSSATLGNAAPNFGRVVASALDSRRLSQDMRESDTRIATNRATSKLVEAQEQAARNSAKVNETEARLRDAEFFRSDMENRWLRDNPGWFKAKKALELIQPIIGSARDAGILFRSIKGFGPETSETFGPQGEHRRTTIKSRR